MENTTITAYSEKPFYKSIFKSDTQLKLPEHRFDVFNKISAYCSHTTRYTLRLVCKQFYCAASINNLSNLVMYDFIIGDEKEKTKFFKALIKTNNPQLITPLVQYAKKEAQHYELKNALYETDPTTSISKKYVQDYYFHPLLEEAIKQENDIIIERLKQEKEINRDRIEDYYNKKCTFGKCLICIACSPCLPCICVCFCCGCVK